MTDPQTASASTRSLQDAVLEALPFHDRRQYDEAERGFVATLDPCLIHAEDGTVVWDMERFAFLADEAPDTVNPSLWRSAQLTSKHGLFTVADRVHQVRGFDLSNMSIVEGETGYIVIDPLVTAEAAGAAMDLVRTHLGDKPVTAVIYTHSHVDHFGGVKGVLSPEDAAERSVPVVAPADFTGHAISENVYAGNAMNRRANFMYGMGLPSGPQGVVGSGLGPATSVGTVTLIPPTHSISSTGAEITLDGVRTVFQVTPGAEAPSDMNVFFPGLRALNLADNVVQCMHNLYTPRGAQVRDAIAWSTYIQEVIEMFGADTEVIFAGHQWPVWGQERCLELLRMQRDLYRYLHDEVLRLANQGYTIHEIPEVIELPEALGTFWSNRGYYGTLSHNCKAIYQRYLGYFDGNPANLDPHPPVEAGKRYVALAGGMDALLTTARAAYEEGDYRWVAELVNHAVFADPDHAEARALQADALEQLGYQAESAVWRNFYLTGALELREGTPPTGVKIDAGELIGAMSIDMMISFLAIRIDGPRAAEHPMTVNLTITDTSQELSLELSNGALVPMAGHDATPDVSAQLDRATFAGLAVGAVTVDQLTDEQIHIEGESSLLATLFGLGVPFDPKFPIVTP